MGIEVLPAHFDLEFGRKPKHRTRDAEATKARILKAALNEFSRNGLGGARVDVIAEKADANKRMLYHYFGSKEELFQTVLENAYIDIRDAEQKLDLDHLPPKEALERLVRFTWEYYLKHPEFITLVNSENLHRAKHLKKSEIVKIYSRRFVSMVDTILQRGSAADRMRRHFGDAGTLRDVVSWLVQETLVGTGLDRRAAQRSGS